MGMQCPGCQKDLGDVLTQEEHRKRLAAKDEAIKEIKASLTAAEATAKDAAGALKERDDLRGKLAEIERRTVRGEAFAEAGVVADEKARRRLEVLYDADQAGKPDAERVDFKAWLTSDETKADPLLSGAFAKPAATVQGAAAKTAPAAVAKAAPSLDKGASSAGTATQQGAVPKSAAEIEAYLRSPAHTHKPDGTKRTLAELRESRAKLQAEVMGAK